MITIYKNRAIERHVRKADLAYKVAAAIRRILKDAYAEADRYGNDASLEDAAHRIWNTVSAYEEQAEKALGETIDVRGNRYRGKAYRRTN